MRLRDRLGDASRAVDRHALRSIRGCGNSDGSDQGRPPPIVRLRFRCSMLEADLVTSARSKRYSLLRWSDNAGSQKGKSSVAPVKRQRTCRP